MFLSTNESSKIISQTLAAGGNIGQINNNISLRRTVENQKSIVKPESWNQVVMNVSGQSGEKIEFL